MGVRTTPELVAGIIEVDVDIPLSPFISAASSLVDRIRDNAIANDLLRDGPDSDDKTREEKLQEIETYLAAHFYTLRDPRVTTERAGPVGASYQSAVALRLFTSHYGQMACALDETGLLELINAGKRRKAGLFWGGRNCEG
jgi:hypothetical protein